MWKIFEKIASAFVSAGEAIASAFRSLRKLLGITGSDNTSLSSLPRNGASQDTKQEGTTKSTPALGHSETFDPFIHGTNTAIFAALVKSEFQVMSPLEMMDEYQTAPMVGELTRSGYNAVGDTTIKEDSIGKTAFAKMTGVNSNSYTLEKVVKNYTSIRVASAENSLSDFKRALSTGLSYAFSNINLLLIYFARARQTFDIRIPWQTLYWSFA
jgi:hypothetical protein